MAIGAMTLMQLSYDSPSDVPPVNTSFIDVYDDARERLRVLEYVRPQLSGLIEQVAADVLDNPGRPFGESMIWRLRTNGETA